MCFKKRKITERAIKTYHVTVCCAVLSHSVMSNSFMTSWTVASRLLCPWDFPGKNIGVGCHFHL